MAGSSRGVPLKASAVSGGGVAAPKLRNGAKVRALTNAIARAAYERVNVGFHGHSIVQGVGSSDTTTLLYSDAQLWRTRGIASVVGRSLNAAGGGAFGAGVETMAIAQSGHFTLGGAAAFSAAYTSAGPNGLLITLNATTDTVTFLSQGPAVRVYGYASASGVVARYAINGGAVTNASAAPAVATGFSGTQWYEFVITGLSAGDSVQLLGATSGNYRVYAVDLDYRTTAGITMHRFAVAGLMGPQVVAAYLDGTDTQPNGGVTWTDPTATGGQVRTMHTDSATTRLGLSAVLAMFDVNDIKGYNYTGQSWGWTLATLSRHMTNYLAALAARSLPVVLVLGPLRNPQASDTAGTPYTQADIIALYKSLSDASTNCAYIDLAEEFTGATLDERYAASLASGLHVDTVHPNKGGAAYYGQLIAQSILDAAAGR